MVLLPEQPKPATARISPAVLRGDLNISNAPISQVTLEFAEQGLVEKQVSGLGDTGSDVDLAMKKLVDELSRRHLVTPFLLKTPIFLGAVDNPHVLTITHGVTLPIRHGDTFYQHTFGVANIPGPPHLIFGQPWLQKYCPKALQIIKEFGITQILAPEPMKIQDLPFKYSASLTPARTPPGSPRLRPIPMPPTNDPKLAFSAGGD